MRGHEGQLSGLGWNEVQTPETEYGTEPRKLDRFVYFTAHAAFNFSRAYFKFHARFPGRSVRRFSQVTRDDIKKGSPHSITERRVPELIPVLGSQPAGDVSHKPGGYYMLPLLSIRPAVTLATLKRAATNFAAW